MSFVACGARVLVSAVVGPADGVFLMVGDAVSCGDTKGRLFGCGPVVLAVEIVEVLGPKGGGGLKKQSLVNGVPGAVGSCSFNSKLLVVVEEVCAAAGHILDIADVSAHGRAYVMSFRVNRHVDEECILPLLECEVGGFRFSDTKAEVILGFT